MLNQNSILKEYDEALSIIASDGTSAEAIFTRNNKEKIIISFEVADVFNLLKIKTTIDMHYAIVAKEDLISWKQTHDYVFLIKNFKEIHRDFIKHYNELNVISKELMDETYAIGTRNNKNGD